MYILYCHVVWSNYRGGFGLDIGFIDHLYTRLGNYNKLQFHYRSPQFTNHHSIR
jgi:hypothetical protein